MPKISALPAAGAFSAAMQFPVNNGGTTQRITGTQLGAASAWQQISATPFTAVNTMTITNIPSYSDILIQIIGAGSTTTANVTAEISSNSSPSLFSATYTLLSGAAGRYYYVSLLFTRANADFSEFAPGGYQASTAATPPAINNGATGIAAIASTATHFSGLNSIRLSTASGTFVAQGSILLFGRG